MNPPLFTGDFKIAGISPIGGLVIEEAHATTHCPKNFLFLNDLPKASKEQFVEMMNEGKSIQLIIIPKVAS